VRVGGRGLASRLTDLIRRVPAWLYSSYAWTLFGLVGPVVWAGVMTAPGTALRWSLVRGGIRLARRLAFMRLDIEGAENIPEPGRPFVLAANHQSYLDALALIEAVPRPMGFVAKRELRQVALVGPLLARLGTLFVERFDLHRGAAESGRFGEAIARGEALAFFPEGTFRDEPGLLPFRMGAFVAASAAGVPVLPVAIRGTRGLMRGDSFLPRPGRARLCVGAPLAPRGKEWQDAVALRDDARAFILEHCGEADLGG
jgi:1-acyl-sn-glycerol-3-phosphate acyltransferase